MTSVVVLGGGPAGLTLALLRARRGDSVTVVESAERLGGMSASVEVAGQRVDLGSHRLHAAAGGPGVDLVRELLGSDLQERPRRGRMRVGGRWVTFPPSPLRLARELPPAFAGRVVADAMTGPLRRVRGDSFADEVQRRLGRTMVTSFYGPYARKLWGLDAELLDEDLARRRVSASSVLALLRRVVATGAGANGTFFYPRLGYGQVIDRLVEECRAAGVRFLTGVAATAVTRASAGGRRVELSDGSALAAGVVASTVPPQVVGRLVAAVPGDVAEILERSRTRAMVLVFLVLEVDRYTEIDAHYLPGAESIAARISESKNYRDGPDPVGRTVLCAEIPCDVGDDTWRADADALAARLVADLDAMGLPTPALSQVEVERLPSVYPVIERGRAGDRLVVNRWLAELDELVSFGRQGLSVADNLHHVMEMAIRLDDALGADGCLDVDAWRVALAEFEEHVVVD